MAILYGNQVGGGSGQNGFVAWCELWYEGSPSSGSVTAKWRIGIWTKWSFDDNSNIVSRYGTTFGPSDKSIPIKTTNNSGANTSYPNWPSVNRIVLDSGSKVFNLTNSTQYAEIGCAITGLYVSGTSVASPLTMTIPALPYSAPLAPTMGSNTRLDGPVNLVTWSNNPTAERPYTSITLERAIAGATGFSVIGTLAADATSYEDSSIIEDMSYRYRVKANGPGGSSQYSAESAETSGKPSAPSNCAVNLATPGTISVTWQDNSVVEDRFQIYRSSDGGANWTLVGEALKNATSFSDDTAGPGTHLYRVRAANGELLSDPADAVDEVTIPQGDTFQSVHEAEWPGLVMRAKYEVAYDETPLWDALVRIYDGTVADGIIEGDLLFEGRVASGEFIDLNRLVQTGDKITMIVHTSNPVSGGTWDTEFVQAVDNNNWTFLGHADDQLVGMTANMQLWTGPLGEYELANAQAVEDPAVLPFSALSVVGAGITISPTATEAQPFRMSISYTLINKFGPTLPSPPLTFFASKPPLEWTTASFVKISGKAPNESGVIAVELYYTEGEYQEAAFLGRVNVADIPTASPNVKDWSFNWTGYLLDPSVWLLANLTVPTQNYTLGVPASKMASLDGRLYFWGNDDLPYRIWMGGNTGNRFSISPGTGGGFVDCEPGVGNIVRNVLKFKTQQGAAIVTALCDNKNSQKEHRFNLVESNISLSNEQSAKGWQAEKIAGAVGCKSNRGALACGDGLYAVSRYGLAITTLTMEYNSQLQVMYVSDAIEPVFLKQYGNQLTASVLLEVNGVLYMTFGTPDRSLDNVIFCYDIGLKAWWTYTLDIDEPVLNMINIDYEGAREGIGLVTESGVYLLPTTMDDRFDTIPEHEVLIESGAFASSTPIQAMQHLSQLELKFDYFIGDMDVEIVAIDQFGRKISTVKKISHDRLQHQLTEYIRVDSVIESFKMVMRGKANMRFTHFLVKHYPKPARIGMMWGFDVSQSHRSEGSIHKTFNDYNDLKKAIIP